MNQDKWTGMVHTNGRSDMELAGELAPSLFQAEEHTKAHTGRMNRRMQEKKQNGEKESENA